MKFNVGGITVTLQGDPSLSKTLVSLKTMVKAFKEGGEGVLLELGALTTNYESNEGAVPEKLQGVLVEFNKVFFLQRAFHLIETRTIPYP